MTLKPQAIALAALAALVAACTADTPLPDGGGEGLAPFTIHIDRDDALPGVDAQAGADDAIDSLIYIVRDGEGGVAAKVGADELHAGQNLNLTLLTGEAEVIILANMARQQIILANDTVLDKKSIYNEKRLLRELGEDSLQLADLALLKPAEAIASDPDHRIPMVGHAKVTVPKTGGEAKVTLRRLVARIDITLDNQTAQPLTVAGVETATPLPDRSLLDADRSMEQSGNYRLYQTVAGWNAQLNKFADVYSENITLPVGETCTLPPIYVNDHSFASVISRHVGGDIKSWTEAPLTIHLLTGGSGNGAGDTDAPAIVQAVISGPVWPQGERVDGIRSNERLRLTYKITDAQAADGK